MSFNQDVKDRIQRNNDVLELVVKVYEDIFSEVKGDDKNIVPTINKKFLHIHFEGRTLSVETEEVLEKLGDAVYTSDLGNLKLNIVKIVKELILEKLTIIV